MTKEMLISSSPHETKIALLEDDQLVEVYYERDTDVGLVGGIYKGRVSRVLPGMQSAFVDIGLERDAFLYVSDFFEDSDEYDRVFTEAENRVARFDQEGGPAPSGMAEPAPAGTGSELATLPPVSPVAPSHQSVADPHPDPAQAATPAPGPLESAPALPPQSPEASPSPAPTDSAGPRGHGFQGHGRRRRGRRFSGHRFGGPKSEIHERPQEHSGEEPHQGLELLPGESLAKYGHGERVVPTETDSISETQASEVPANLVSAEAPSDATESLATSAPEALPFTAANTEAAEPKEQSRGGAIVGPPDSDNSLSMRETAEPETIHTNSLLNHVLATPEPAMVEALQEVDSEVREQARIDRAIPESGEALSAKSSPTPDQSASLEAGAQTDAGTDLLAGSEDVGDLHSGFPLSLEEVETGSSDAEAIRGEVEEMGMDEVGAENAKAIEAGEGGAAGNATPDDSPTPEGGSADRSYTLREPQQRPRFAPRRQRRGRFGFHGTRESGRKDGAPRAGNFQPVQINEVLKEGQEILVQIAKEPLGTKGARITSHIALPGRYLVYMPTINHIGVSRKISSEEERIRLRNTIQENRGNLTGGIIVRTAAAGRSEEELKADLRFLGSVWSDIRAKTDRSKAPALIHRDLNVVQRTLRDLLSPDYKTIRIDNEVEYEQVVDFVSRCQPSLVGHVRLYTREVPLFEEFGVQHEIDKALKPKVWLKSGGYIVINQTEALVSIDVNTGKYVGKTNRLEDTIVKVNIDAVREIVRQIRIRDLGGIIVIDFIDMDDRRNRNKVVQALEEALRTDRAPTKILSFNEFGLVALTRKRVKQSLERTLCEPCPYCSGAGWVKSVLTVSYEILAETRKMGSQIESKVMTLRVHPDVARALKSRDSVLLSEIENATHKEIVIKSDLNIQQERYEIF